MPPLLLIVSNNQLHIATYVSHFSWWSHSFLNLKKGLIFFCSSPVLLSSISTSESNSLFQIRSIWQLYFCCNFMAGQHLWSYISYGPLPVLFLKIWYVHWRCKLSIYLPRWGIRTYEQCLYLFSVTFWKN